MSQSEHGGLEFNWTALSVFVFCVGAIVSAETFIYSSIVKEHIATLRRDVIAADAALEKRIVASEVTHLDLQRQIDRATSENERLRQMDEQLRRDYEAMTRELAAARRRDGRRPE